MQFNLEREIESVLFWKGEPIKFLDLAQIFSVSEEEIKLALSNLEKSLQNRGVSLILDNNKVTMVTSPETASIIEKIQKEELKKDLSKATLETLSIILYRGPLKRSDLDYVRGVNSQFILRNLLIRGLIEKNTDPKDERSFIYRASPELLAYMGISKIEDLPEFNEVNKDIENFLNNQKLNEDNESKENIK